MIKIKVFTDELRWEDLNSFSLLLDKNVLVNLRQSIKDAKDKLKQIE